MILKNTLNRLNKGSVLAETALAIPILLGVAFVVIEFGNVLYLNNSLNQIARSAARYAAVTSNYTQQDLINNSGANSILPDPSKLTLTVTPDSGAPKSVGTAITINVTYNYTPIVNPFRLFNSNKSWLPQVQSSSVVRSEVSNAS